MKKPALKQSNSFLFLLRRLLAYAIDWYLCAVIMISGNALYMHLKGIDVTYYMTLEKYSNNDAIIVLLIMLLIHLAYYVFTTRVLDGQTVGKKICKIKLVSNDDSNVKLIQLLFREIVGVIIIEGYFSPFSSYFRTFLGMYFDDIMLLIGGWYAVAAASLVIARFTKYNRMIHDLIGGTKVIEAK